MAAPIYRQVKSVPGLQVTRDGQFFYQGRVKKATYPTTITGRRATVRITIMMHGKAHYWQASKLVAEAWKPNYEPDDYLTYRDGNCHNICADNLIVNDKKGYWQYMQRHSSMKIPSLDERKRKLKLVSDQALMTLHYFETLSMDEINHHVQDYLYPCLVQYGEKTLQLGERKTMDTAEEAIGYMYESIMNGSCIYNYERFCKKIMSDIKKKGHYGEYWHKLIKPIKIEVEQLNLDRLWQKYKVTHFKKQ